MTTLQVHGLMLFAVIYAFIETAVAWSRRRVPSERRVFALVTTALGISVASVGFVFVSELAAPSSAIQVAPWEVWFFAACDAFTLILVGVRAIWWLQRPDRRA